MDKILILEILAWILLQGDSLLLDCTFVLFLMMMIVFSALDQQFLAAWMRA